jgi:hypothetical protein
MIIFDSCLWIAFLNDQDSCHQEAVDIFLTTVIADVILPVIKN